MATVRETPGDQSPAGEDPEQPRGRAGGRRHADWPRSAAGDLAVAREGRPDAAQGLDQSACRGRGPCSGSACRWQFGPLPPIRRRQPRRRGGRARRRAWCQDAPSIPAVMGSRVILWIRVDNSALDRPPRVRETRLLLTGSRTRRRPSEFHFGGGETRSDPVRARCTRARRIDHRPPAKERLHGREAIRRGCRGSRFSQREVSSCDGMESLCGRSQFSA